MGVGVRQTLTIRAWHGVSIALVYAALSPAGSGMPLSEHGCSSGAATLIL